MADIPQGHGRGPVQPPGGWTKHAPPGGITLGGKSFKGGTFIPNEDMKNATPEELKKLKDVEDLVAKVGPEQAKKMLGKFNTSPQQQELATQVPGNTTPPTKSANTAPLYIFDDGSILGSNIHFGDFVIKIDDKLLGKELDLLNMFKTKRLDIIDNGTVLSWNNNSMWPVTDKKDEDILSGIQDKFTKVPLQDYKLLNNLSPEIRDLISPKQEVKMSLGDTERVPIETKGMRDEVYVNPSKKDLIKLLEQTYRSFIKGIIHKNKMYAWSNIGLDHDKIADLLNLDGRSIDRGHLYIRKDDNGEPKVSAGYYSGKDYDDDRYGILDWGKKNDVQVMSLNTKLSEKEYAFNKFAAKLYKLMGVPVVNMSFRDEGEEVGDVFDRNDPELLGNVLNHGMLDKVLGNTHVLNNIIVIQGTPFRQLNEKIEPEKDNNEELDPFIEALPKDELSRQLEMLLSKISPELVDKLLREVNYPDEHRKELKDIIMSRLTKLREDLPLPQTKMSLPKIDIMSIPVPLPGNKYDTLPTNLSMPNILKGQLGK